MTAIWRNSIKDNNNNNNNNKPSIQSKGQFKFLFDNNNNKSDAKKNARLRLLLRLSSKCGQMKVGDWAKTIDAYITADMDDYDIYDNVRNIVFGRSIQSSLLSVSLKSDDINNNTDRGSYLATIILDCIPSSLQPLSLLDYGCSEGSITYELAKQLNLTSSQVFGADVRDCSGKGYTFIKLSDDQDSHNQLPFADGSIDVIVASMVLHHVQDQRFLLSEFKRILSTTGIIIIREHDCRDSYFSVFLDIIHGLYSFVHSADIKWPGFINEAHMIYHSKHEWDELFQEEGFKLSLESEASLRHYNYEDNDTKKMKNILKAYCAVYNKI